MVQPLPLLFPMAMLMWGGCVRSLACNICHPTPSKALIGPFSTTRNLGRWHLFASYFCCFNHKSKQFFCVCVGGGSWKFTSPGLLLKIRSALPLLTWSGANVFLLMSLSAKLSSHLGLQHSCPTFWPDNSKQHFIQGYVLYSYCGPTGPLGHSLWEIPKSIPCHSFNSSSVNEDHI